MKTTILLVGGFLLSIACAVALVANSPSPDHRQAGTQKPVQTGIQLPKGKLPVLKVKGTNDTTEVYLESQDVQMEVTGNIATTRHTMVFKNRTGKILEGELLFPLPDGVTINYYALDINGKMREAVPVEKAKATQVFEEIEQRRVDPGLLERVEGNNFRTRVYPIPANGTRTIIIGYDEELTAPVGIPQVAMQSASGSYYFLAACTPLAETRKKDWSDRIGIIWDASLSGLQRDTQKELETLDLIFKAKKNLSVTLYLLNNRLTKNGEYTVRNGNWTDLRKALESVVYDGGTNFNAIRLKNISNNEFLLFSDGLSSLSDADFLTPDNEMKKYPIHCIASSAKADYSAMKWIAAQTNAKYINLNALSSEDLQKEIAFETLHFLGTERNSALREVYPSVSTPVRGNFSVAGILDTHETSVTLLFGYGNKIEKRIPLTLKAKDAKKQGNVHRIWAQKKISELDMRYEQNKEELTELGQQFGIVTRNTSLIVLETLQDYIQYDIVPPAELQAEYFRWKKDRQEEARRQQLDLLTSALLQAQALQNWWKTDFSPKKSKYPQPDDKEAVNFTPPVIVRDEDVLEDRTISRADLTVAREQISVETVEGNNEGVDIMDLAEYKVVVEEAPVALYYREDAPAQNKAKEEARPRIPQATIKLVPIKQENEYSKQLTGNLSADYATYLKLRPDYINTPTFYFDMADWFFRHNDREKALRILTSIAELDLENASLYRLLGYRLKEYKEYALETYICKKVIAWRPMEPQSYRDYALALADNGRYQAALDSLYSLLTHSYARNITARSAGIEEVVVTEINRLIALNKLNYSTIDKKLVQAMPVDIRVVINWNMNSTDIDLHVKDPLGETCYYSHPATQTGGRISQDITQGYGPEQFMLKKAVKGKYEVFVNYFGDSQVKADGPSTVMAEIYTQYSDSSEQRQVVCLQMSKESKAKDGLLKVAEFEF